MFKVGTSEDGTCSRSLIEHSLSVHTNRWWSQPRLCAASLDGLGLASDTSALSVKGLAATLLTVSGDLLSALLSRPADAKDTALPAYPRGPAAQRTMRQALAGAVSALTGRVVKAAHGHSSDQPQLHDPQPEPDRGSVASIGIGSRFEPLSASLRTNSWRGYERANTMWTVRRERELRVFEMGCGTAKLAKCLGSKAYE